MQFVPGISFAQTLPAVPASTAAGRERGLWILDSWRDLFLSVCTRLLLVPVCIGAQRPWSAADIYVLEEALHLHADLPEAEEHLRIAKRTGAQSP